MEEGTRTRKTVFVGGIGDEVDEAILFETFSTFGVFCYLAQILLDSIFQPGDIIEVQLPTVQSHQSQTDGLPPCTTHLLVG